MLSWLNTYLVNNFIKMLAGKFRFAVTILNVLYLLSIVVKPPLKFHLHYLTTKTL